ncbi:MAG: hypothetical protein M3032_01305 [Verrucomicrobiota bacterium]|nr:hypothetical protein [Verrucomicrobiota bacterium]
MIDSPASESFNPARALPEEKRISPLVWMNLICLDAPLVAVSWQWLFARCFHAPIPRGATAALFLTAWFVYLADRFGDSVSLDRHAPTSLRQRVCLNHVRVWLVGVAVIALADLLVVATQLDRMSIVVGGSVGAFAVAYLLINRLRPSSWRVLPMKEISIGFIFAAGTMVGLLRNLTTSALPVWLSFACLCSLNCISIALWERELDSAQDRISIATAFPRIEPYVAPVLAFICVTNVVLAGAGSATGVIHLSVALSAFLLGAVHAWRNSLPPDVRTALADLVLLTPVAALAVTTFA